MSEYFLKSLSIEGFRGIYNKDYPLVLDFDQLRPNSIHAVNGVGKSSVYEAISYALFGKVLKLYQLQLQEGREGYLNNLFHPSEDGVIELQLIDSSSAEIISSQILSKPDGTRQITRPSGHPAPSDVLSELASSFVMLDHDAVQRFVAANPTERARELSKLLGLHEYSLSARRLAAVSNSTAMRTDFDLNGLAARTRAAESQYEAARQLVQSQFDQFAEVLGNRPPDDLSTLEDVEDHVLRRLAAIPGTPRNGENALHNIDFGDLESAVRGELNFEGQQVLTRLTAERTLKTELQSAVATAGDALTELLRLTNEAKMHFDSASEATHRQLLGEARKLAESGEWVDAMKCPLCGSTCSYSVVAHVEGRLDTLLNLDISIKTLNSTWEASRLLGLNVGALPEELNLSWAGSITEIDDILRHGGYEISLQTQLLQSTVGRIREWLVSDITRIDDELSVARVDLPPSIADLLLTIERARVLSAAIDDARQKSTELESQRRVLRRMKRWQEFVQSASSIWAAAEEQQMGEMIGEVDSLTKEYFQEIMRTRDVVPVVARTGDKVSLELERFHGGTSARAKAVLSESFRNAYVLAVFLAAAMKSRGGSRFIVLDDVTSSFDAGHQLSLAELLRSTIQFEASRGGLQVILLTHDTLLEKYFQASQDVGSWNHHRLVGRAPDGVLQSERKGLNEMRTRILDLIDAGANETAKLYVRQYLEAQLSAIIRRMRIPVPIDFAIRDDRKMVSNALDAINAFISLLNDAGKLSMPAPKQNHLQDVIVPTIVGNWVSHFETGNPDDIDGLMLKAVLERIDEFADCFKEIDTATGQHKWRKRV